MSSITGSVAFANPYTSFIYNLQALQNAKKTANHLFNERERNFC